MRIFDNKYLWIGNERNLSLRYQVYLCSLSALLCSTKLSKSFLTRARPRLPPQIISKIGIIWYFESDIFLVLKFYHVSLPASPASPANGPNLLLSLQWSSSPLHAMKATLSSPAQSGPDVDFAGIQSVPAQHRLTLLLTKDGAAQYCCVLLELVLGSSGCVPPPSPLSPPASQQGQQFKIHPAVKLKQANDSFAPNTHKSQLNVQIKY